jgi:hypothetical protein
MRRAALVLACLPLLLAAGCVSDRAQKDIADSAAVIYNAAESLPPSPQRAAIQANAKAIGHALGNEVAP